MSSASGAVSPADLLAVTEARPLGSDLKMRVWTIAGSDSGGIDPGLISRISKLLSRSGSGDGERTALLNAMKPYLSEKRRSKMDKAMKLAKFAEIAELAADEFGGDDDV